VNSHDEAIPLDPEPFLSALRTALRPEVLLRASDDLAAVIQAVRDTAKTGTVTLKVTVKPDEHDPSVAIVSADTTTKIPRPSLHGRLLWPLENGRLSTKDPRQLELGGLSAVDGTRNDDAQKGTA
jgi:hypothetical protein